MQGVWTGGVVALRAVGSTLWDATTAAVAWSWSRAGAARPLPSLEGPLPEEVEQSIADLRGVRDEVVRREASLREQVAAHRRHARELCVDRGDVGSARVELRLWRIYVGQLAHMRVLRTTLESHVVSLENAMLNRQVFVSLRRSLRATVLSGTGSSAYEERVSSVLDNLSDMHARTSDIMEEFMHSEAPSALPHGGGDDDVPTTDDDSIEELLRRWTVESDDRARRRALDAELPECPTDVPAPTTTHDDDPNDVAPICAA